MKADKGENMYKFFRKENNITNRRLTEMEESQKTMEWHLKSVGERVNLPT